MDRWNGVHAHGSIVACQRCCMACSNQRSSVPVLLQADDAAAPAGAEAGSGEAEGEAALQALEAAAAGADTAHWLDTAVSAMQSSRCGGHAFG